MLVFNIYTFSSSEDRKRSDGEVTRADTGRGDQTLNKAACFDQSFEANQYLRFLVPLLTDAELLLELLLQPHSIPEKRRTGGQTGATRRKGRAGHFFKGAIRQIQPEWEGNPKNVTRTTSSC